MPLKDSIEGTFQTHFHQTTIPLMTIERFWKQREHMTVIDVRSPSEFAQGSIPEAINLPLLSDAERSHIGILYKTFGKSHAISEGYSILRNVWPEFIEQLQTFSKDRNFLIYCARGGMRSRIMAAIFQSFGYYVQCLEGGYKTFRNWNLQQLERINFTLPLLILHGLTGTGKTKILKQLNNFIDLEELAQHRGSLFGAVGKKPVTVKNFQANLLVALQQIDPNKPIFIEGESRKIGNVEIPGCLFKAMKSGKNILLQTSLETRIQRIAEDYIPHTEEQKQELEAATQKLTSLLGKNNVNRLLQWIQEGAYMNFFRFLLEEHYDKKYKNTMKHYQYYATIDAEDVSQAIQQLHTLADSNNQAELPYVRNG